MNTVNARKVMPQIDDTLSFMKWAHETKLAMVFDLVDPKTLKPTQLHPNQFDPRFFTFADLQKPAIVSDDGYIIDGHHRVIAHKINHTEVPVLRIQQPLSAAIKTIERFPNVHTI